MCDCFQNFIFQSKAIIYIDISILSPVQSDLFILTDGALPLPAHLLSRIVANVKLIIFAFVLYVPVTSRFIMLYKYLCWFGQF